MSDIHAFVLTYLFGSRAIKLYAQLNNELKRCVLTFSNKKVCVLPRQIEESINAELLHLSVVFLNKRKLFISVNVTH